MYNAYQIKNEIIDIWTRLQQQDLIHMTSGRNNAEKGVFGRLSQ